MTNFSNVLVYGWDNGGVELACALCGECIAAGGCGCCDENQVTLSDLASATRDHICKENSDVQLR